MKKVKKINPHELNVKYSILDLWHKRYRPQTISRRLSTPLKEVNVYLRSYRKNKILNRPSFCGVEIVSKNCAYYENEWCYSTNYRYYEFTGYDNETRVKIDPKNLDSNYTNFIQNDNRIFNSGFNNTIRNKELR